jgi:hypothetical protein
MKLFEKSSILLIILLESEILKTTRKQTFYQNCQKLATPFFSEKSYHFQSSTVTFPEYPWLTSKLVKVSFAFLPK